MKGVILRRAPKLTLVDVTHDVPPQDVPRASWLLARTAPWFPPGTVHVVVVDPGVGTARRALVATLGDQIVVAPDNGVIARLAAASRSVQAWELAAPGLGLQQRSATFHGRDLFAPAGALLASGRIAPAECGDPITPVLPDIVGPTVQGGQARGLVVAVDRFGNLVTDLHRDLLPGPPRRVSLDEQPIERVVETYGEARAGELVALFGSDDFLEISVVDGDAAQRLGVSTGATVRLETSP